MNANKNKKNNDLLNEEAIEKATRQLNEAERLLQKETYYLTKGWLQEKIQETKKALSEFELSIKQLDFSEHEESREQLLETTKALTAKCKDVDQTQKWAARRLSASIPQFVNKEVVPRIDEAIKHLRGKFDGTKDIKKKQEYYDKIQNLETCKEKIKTSIQSNDSQKEIYKTIQQALEDTIKNQYKKILFLAPRETPVSKLLSEAGKKLKNEFDKQNLVSTSTIQSSDQEEQSVSENQSSTPKRNF